jgi:hypothetical protein
MTVWNALFCADDTEAIDKAKRLLDGYGFEFWRGERLVKRFTRAPDAPPWNKGIEFQLVQTANPTGFKWTVHLDAKRNRIGEPILGSLPSPTPNAPSTRRSQRRSKATVGM